VIVNVIVNGTELRWTETAATMNARDRTGKETGNGKETEVLSMLLILAITPIRRSNNTLTTHICTIIHKL
jgi:hypothetical protein